MKADQRPIERYEQEKNEKFDDGETGAHDHQITRREISVGISHDQDPGLVGEKLSARGKGPNHAEQHKEG